MDIPDEAVIAALDAWGGCPVGASPKEQIARVLEAAAPYMLAEAFARGWREGAGIPSPVNLDTGELMHDQAMQPSWNPYKEKHE